MFYYKHLLSKSSITNYDVEKLMRLKQKLNLVILLQVSVNNDIRYSFLSIISNNNVHLSYQKRFFDSRFLSERYRNSYQKAPSTFDPRDEIIYFYSFPRRAFRGWKRFTFLDSPQGFQMLSLIVSLTRSNVFRSLRTPSAITSKSLKT